MGKEGKALEMRTGTVCSWQGLEVKGCGGVVGEMTLEALGDDARDSVEERSQVPGSSPEMGLKKTPWTASPCQMVEAH